MDIMINAALFGCGEMGRVHASCIDQIAGIQLVACCDIVESKAVALKEQYQATYATTDTHFILKDPNIDVVYILTSTDSHKSLCHKAIAYKKHILIEKPVTMSARDTYQIHQAVNSAGIVVMPAFKFRYYDMVQKACSIVSHPFMASVQVMDDPWSADFWANDPVKGGGNVISQGVHGADLLHYCIGSEPVSVYAVGGNYHQSTGVVDNIAATFRFDNGAVGNFMVGDCGQAPLLSKFSIQLYGSPGSVLVSDRLTRLHFKPQESSDVIEYTALENGFLEENKALVKAIAGKAPLISTLWDGYVAQAMIESAIRSAKSGQVETVLTMGTQSNNAQYS